MKPVLTIVVLAVAVAIPVPVWPQTPAGDAVPVTVENFKRAESDMYFAIFVKRGAFGKFFHYRERRQLF